MKTKTYYSNRTLHEALKHMQNYFKQLEEENEDLNLSLNLDYDSDSEDYTYTIAILDRGNYGKPKRITIKVVLDADGKIKSFNVF